MIKYKKQYFNMVEIALAIAIIAFGMSSILVLFPVGLNASKDSMVDNYSADMIEQFTAYLQGYSNESTGAAHYNSLMSVYSKTQAQVDSAMDTASDKFLIKLKANPSALKNVISDWAIYQAAEPENGGTSNQIYFMVHRSNSDTATTAKYDFLGAITVWKSPVDCRIYTTQGTPGAHKFYPDPYNTGNLYDKFTAINIELSWPLNKPYADRQKRFYYYVINKP